MTVDEIRSQALQLSAEERELLAITLYHLHKSLARLHPDLRLHPILLTIECRGSNSEEIVAGRPGMHVVSHHTEQHLQRLAAQEPRTDRAKRLRTVLLARQGFTAPEIATCTGFSRRMVQTWVERYNREGLAGLETKAGRGRKPPLTPDQQQQLQQRLDAGPLPEDGVCTLRGQDVQRILEREFGQLRSLSAVYGLLHRLGYSSLVPRPQHPAADPVAQDEFKKSLGTNSRRSRRNIPTTGSKSSTKMKRGLASKAR